MKFEVIETAGQWIVQREGEELGRFPEQDQALNHVADRLRRADVREEGASVSVRYQARTQANNVV